jgi:hypothetical protein
MQTQLVIWQKFIMAALCNIQLLQIVNPFFLFVCLLTWKFYICIVFLCAVLQENCMVCGIDAFHDTGRRGGSVAGFVASLNQTFTRWFSRACFQGAGQELVDGLKTCFISALKYYYDVSMQDI